MVFSETLWRPWTLWFECAFELKESESNIRYISNTGNGSHPFRSKSAGSSDPTTNFCDKRIINQLDKSALTSLKG